MDYNKNKSILITGIPRSGTSLLTRLLSQQENTLCFSEPVWLREIRYENQSRQQFAESLFNKINDIRNEIKKGNPVEITVNKNTGKIPDNYFQRSNKKVINIKQTKKIHTEYNKDLVLVVKSNTLFTTCLKDLVNTEAWNVFSLVRNPLFVLRSWRSLDIPISKGLIKIGELYSKDLRKIVREENLLVRQVKILNWFYKQYGLYNNNNCIKYESVIDFPNKTLEKILLRKYVNADKLTSQNIDSRYPNMEKEIILSTINAHCPEAKSYY